MYLKILRKNICIQQPYKNIQQQNYQVTVRVTAHLDVWDIRILRTPGHADSKDHQGGAPVRAPKFTIEPEAGDDIEVLGGPSELVSG